MRKSLFRLTCLVLAVFLAPTVYGQNRDWTMTLAAVYTDDDGARNLDDSVAGAQLSIGGAITENTSVEALLGYSDIDGFPGQQHLELGANLLVFIDRESTFAPYLLAGVGYLRTSTDNAGEESRPTLNLGVGVKWALGDSAVAIRGEYRARLAWENDNEFVDQIASIGLQFSFGAGTKAKSGFDSDQDGVIDHWDRCPETRPGVLVDESGCAFDSDGDGVPDSADECPNTAAGVPVDAVGCPRDGDRDGVADNQDKCRNTTFGAEVDSNGCERDDDADGVFNRLDRCPNSPAGVRVDIYGCEIKDVIALPGVNFETNSDRLLLGAAQVLSDAAATLKMHADLRVEVAGHTDSVGNAAANESLSVRRAITVRDFLIAAGVNAANVTAKGYGESRPVADNASLNGRTANRRVELIILNR